MQDDVIHLHMENAINLDKVGKYGKFVKFSIYKDLEGKLPDVIRQEYSISFYKENINKKKLTEEDTFLAMENMQENLDRCIEEELKKDYKLQAKIAKIQEKAKQRINKLKEKPTNKLREQYHYGYIKEYFDTKRFIQHSSEES